MNKLAFAACTLLTLTLPAHSEENCSLRSHESCSGSNDLMWAKGTTAAVRQFLKHQSGIVKEVLANLGSSDERRFLKDGVDLFIGCRPHDCGDKSALVLSQEGKILAVSILNYRSVRDVKLEIFVKDGAPKEYLASEIKSTLNEGFENQASGRPQDRIVIEQVDITTVP